MGDQSETAGLEPGQGLVLGRVIVNVLRCRTLH